MAGVRARAALGSINSGVVSCQCFIVQLSVSLRYNREHCISSFEMNEKEAAVMKDKFIRSYFI